MSAQNQLESVLQSLSGIEHVLGGLVASSDGEFLASFMPDLYDIDSLTEFCHKLSDISSALEGLGIVQKETVLNFDGIKLVIKSQVYGHLLIMCQSNVSIPLLNLSTNIVYKKVSAILNETYDPAHENVNGSNTMSNMTISLKRSSIKANIESEDKVVEKLVSKAMIAQIESLLANFIGPVAKLVIKKTIKKLGGDGYQLSNNKLIDFVEDLETRISDAGQKREFRKQVKEFTQYT